MKRTYALAFALLFTIASSAFADLHGSWTASSQDAKPGRVQLNITRGATHTMGQSMNISDFSGLTDAQVAGTASVPVHFQVVREAGTVVFDGTFRNGDGAGQWTFAPSRGYISALRTLGVDFDLDGDSEEDQLLTVTLLDVSTAYIKSMQAAGYRESLEKYLSMRIFKVTPELVTELHQLGFDHVSADELVSTRIFKITPDYIRQMRAAGWNLSLDELQSSRIHKATPEFAEEMKRLGYGNLSFDDLVSFRIHKVTPELITELRDLGYSNISADDLVAMRIHRVTPDYIRELKNAGYSGIPVEKLIEMKIHRIDVTRLK
jgi:hypothetical protein